MIGRIVNWRACGERFSLIPEDLCYYSNHDWCLCINPRWKNDYEKKDYDLRGKSETRALLRETVAFCGTHSIHPCKYWMFCTRISQQCLIAIFNTCFSKLESLSIGNWLKWDCFSVWMSDSNDLEAGSFYFVFINNSLISWTFLIDWTDRYYQVTAMRTQLYYELLCSIR